MTSQYKTMPSLKASDREIKRLKELHNEEIANTQFQNSSVIKVGQIPVETQEAIIELLFKSYDDPAFTEDQNLDSISEIIVAKLFKMGAVTQPQKELTNYKFNFEDLDFLYLGFLSKFKINNKAFNASKLQIFINELRRKINNKIQSRLEDILEKSNSNLAPQKSTC